MAFIAVPIVLSSISGLTYYLWSSKGDEKEENKNEIPIIKEIGSKYSNVLNELKKEPKHPILQKLEVKHEFAPTLQEIKNKKLELKHVIPNIKNDLTLMEQFVIALNNRRNNLKKVEI